ncbi:hypothetical protein BS47DRAFT_723721 [Hydnum rufescens UP504]|uniref:T6SS Phospholipase effector Tle1-like catalytic domain-containing protein n=1 Tax=Hydnum rufescens UP504 TaxID=1448309 RepID=A0A9P6B3X5_9AGAM|nr:hypothetical protein BS47DRAFT_723721 [Hydnum rufescens UP504]
MLEKNNTTKQVVYYQAGIGTYVAPGFLTPVGKWVAKTADLALAWYLDDHVKDGYRFLQSTWKPGDRICMFGFSRGAYTARALAGMLYKVGLLPPGMVEQVDFAYSIYMEGRRSNTYKDAFSRMVNIEFIGVWDTVSSVGALYPRVLPFSANNNITKTFRHALALDERRAKFRSNTWHVSRSANKNPHKKIAARCSFYSTTFIRWCLHGVRTKALWMVVRPRMTAAGQDPPGPTDVMEVWFPGCHADVGGGNVSDFMKVDGQIQPRSMLSNIPLRWMIKEIILADAGIIFHPSAMSRFGIDHATLVNEAKEKHKGATIPPASPPVQTKSNVEDFKAPIHDELSMPRLGLIVMWLLWWLLEFLPVPDFNQDQNNRWGFTLRINRGRPRDIPKYSKAKNVNSRYIDGKTGNIPTLFHKSVEHRMKASESETSTWGSLWVNNNQPYKPRVLPTTGEFTFVE